MLPAPEKKFAPGEAARAVRDRSGVLVGFQDPATGQFISRSDALQRLAVSRDRLKLVDSFGEEVGVGSVAIPMRGREVTYKVKAAEYARLDTRPEEFKPKSNQEIIERVVVADKSGKLTAVDISYGLGGRYDTSKTGGKFRYEVSKAAGLSAGERLPTRKLKDSIIYREFQVKTIRG